ncbi:MAG: D-tyrosyl-tRNA(Tyr) deacylase [Propionibacteriaceae bacterium]|jgi:D-tyrosyl-tRNA(Tyr) deacylase|nr:D-tyrosyl-tRNA(Tyr) deacylase [Propionibacteriaceae bacterium]
MRIVLQRARRAEVRVDGAVVGRLPRPGLVALVGATATDTPAVAARLARKVWELRILENPGQSAGSPEERAAAGWSRGDVSCSDIGAPLLVVSQFTLYADTRKGRRPSWSRAAPGPVAEPLVEAFVTALRDLGAHVETGVFGALMEVELVNTGPVTIILEIDEA